MPVLQAISLDIPTAETHTDTMLTCRSGTLCRMLTLLGLVFALVGFVSVGWSQETLLMYKEVVDGVNVTFPYLSPVQDQRNILLNTFMIQMKIFGVISGAAGSVKVEALKYLAMTACLVGALMIVFNVKLRKGPIFGAWLLLVIICLFSPYGSKLLFHPLTNADSETYISGTKVAAVDSCLTDSTMCGFTPQLAAIHVASVLQLTFSDLFNSMGWMGLMESLKALETLKMNPFLVASPEWPAKVADLKARCSASVADWNNIMDARQAATTATNAQYILDLGTVWTQIGNSFLKASDTAGDYMYPPQVIVLYDETSPVFTDTTANSQWQDPDIKDRYVQGINELYQGFMDTNKRVDFIEGGTLSTTDTVISIKQALTELDAEHKLFQAGESAVGSSGGVFPGFLFTWSGATSNASDAADEYRACYNVGIARRKDTDSISSGCEDSSSGSAAKLSYPTQVAYMKFLFTGKEEDKNKGAFFGYSYTEWTPLLMSLKNPGSPLSKMPVGVAHYKLAKPTSGSPTKPTVIEAAPLSSSPVYDCTKEGNILIDEAVNWTIGQYGRAPNLEPLRVILADTKAFSGDVLTLTDISSNPNDTFDNIRDICVNPKNSVRRDQCISLRKGELELAQSLIQAYNSKLQEMGASREETVPADDRYRLLLKLFMEGVDRSTNALRPTTEVERIATDETQTIDIKGSNLLTSVGGWGAKFFGDIFVGLGALFSGPVAQAIVYFLAMFVDLALMALIILTPIMFLIALAMPSAAIGVLTISVMGVFILKAVPITLLILNNVAGLIYISIGSVSSEHSESLRNMIIIAMAGLYANLIGMTFFLLFKMGDASAVLSRFTGMDSGANKIAEMGMNATKAAAALAALPVFGAVGGAIGSRFGSAVAARAGVAPELASLVRGNQKAAEDKTADGTGGNLKDSNNNQLVDSQGKPFSAEEEARIEAKKDEIKAAQETFGLSEQEASELFGRVSDNPDMPHTITDKNGNTFGLGKNGDPVWMSGGEGYLDSLKQQEQDELAQKVNERIDAGKAAGLNEAQATQLANTGKLKTTDADGNDVEYKINGQGQVEQVGKNGITTAQVGDSIPNLTSMSEASAKIAGPDDAKKAGEERSAKIGAVEKSGLKLSQDETATLVDTGTVTAKDAKGDYVEHKLAANGAIESRQITKDGVMLAKAETTSSVTGGAAGTAAQVTVVGGRLDGVGTVDSLKAAELKVAESGTSSSNEKGGTSSAGGLTGGSDSKQPPQQNSADTTLPADKTPDSSDKGPMLPPVNQEQQQESPSVTEARKARSHTLNQQFADAQLDFETRYGDALASIKEKEKVGEKLTKFEGSVKEFYAKLQEQDPAGLALSEQVKAKANVESLMASMAAREGADKLPSFAQSMLSGLYGGLAGGGGGLAKIPVIGTAIGEALNEFHQAPERARAWNAAGGLGSWWSAQGDAKRMGFYQKEMAPLAASAQYNQMVNVGGFQAQAEIARQAAGEAVSKSRTQWEAMLADRKGAHVASYKESELKDIKDGIGEKITVASIQAKHPEAADDMKRIEELRNSAIELKFHEQLIRETYSKGPLAMNATELAGLGRHEAQSRISSLRGEAAIAQTASLKVKTLKAGLNSDMMLDKTNLKDFTTTVETDVFLTPDMLATMYGNIGVKSAAARNDELMVSNYGIVEKHYMRGKDNWDSTRGMAFDREAAGRFAALDVDTDYLAAGHLKMVQGKEGHMERVGQYQSLVKYRHDGHAMVQDFVTQQIRSNNAKFKLSLGKIDVNVDTPESWTVEQRAKVEKIAKEQMKELGKTIPLDAVFDVATVAGRAKYEQKVMTAFFDEKSQAQENVDKMNKAASNMFAAQLTNVKDFTRKLNMRNKQGYMVDLGSSNARLTEKIYELAGAEHMSEVSKIFIDVMSKHQNELHSGTDKVKGTASMNTSMNVLNTIKSEVRAKLGDFGREFVQNLENDIKNENNFRIRHGRFEYGAIDADGTVI